MKKVSHKINHNGEYVKRCSSCKNYLSLTAFGERKDRWDKKDHICKECRHNVYIKWKQDTEVIKNKDEIFSRKEINKYIKECNRFNKYLLDKGLYLSITSSIVIYDEKGEIVNEHVLVRGIKDNLILQGQLVIEEVMDEDEDALLIW